MSDVIEQKKGESSDSNDEYFKMLEDSVNAQDSDQEDIVVKKQVYDQNQEYTNDEDYYNHTNDVNCSLSMQLKEDSDILWQSLLRSAHHSTDDSKKYTNNYKIISHIGYKTNASAVLLIQQWLFSYLPYSSAIYGISKCLSSPCYDLFVDNYLHPSLAITTHHSINTSNASIIITVSIYSTPLILRKRDELLSIMRCILQYILRKDGPLTSHTLPIIIEYEAIDENLIECIDYAMVNLNIGSISECNSPVLKGVFVYDGGYGGPSSSVTYALPDGYSFVTLRYVLLLLLLLRHYIIVGINSLRYMIVLKM